MGVQAVALCGMNTQTGDDKMCGAGWACSKLAVCMQCWVGDPAHCW